jgi:Leucine-rich repeat (LRR) protein
MVSKKLFFNISVLFALMITVQCPLFGPEPGDPVYPAPIDQGDSAAVRAILDSNKLKSISVRQVIDQYTQGRITIVRFNSLELDSFILSSDFQKLDSLDGIDLSANKLIKINVPDSLKFSKNILGIGLANNLLPEFPIGVLKIKGLMRVDVSYNKITSISNQLINSGFRQIYFDHNKLCSVTDSERLWLDSVQNNWAAVQDCP